MKKHKLIPLVVLPVVTIVSVAVYYNASQINEALKTNYAANILLIILISVDGVGGALVPFLSIKPSNARGV